MNDEHFVEYNDYASLVRFHLKNYRRYTATAAYLRRNIRLYEERLGESQAAAPIAKYTDMPGGGTPELNSVEQTVEDVMDVRAELARMRRGLADVIRHLLVIDDTAALLEPIDHDIIAARYFDGYDWEQVGTIVHLSSSRARHRANDAVRQLAIIIFGAKADMTPQQMFLFAF